MSPLVIALVMVMRLALVGVRVDEGWELGTVVDLLHVPLLTTTVLVVFAFAFLVVEVGIVEGRRGVVLTWHIVQEVLLIPLFVYIAMHVALDPLEPFADLDFLTVRWLLVAVFLAIQILVGLAIFHIRLAIAHCDVAAVRRLLKGVARLFRRIWRGSPR